MPSPGEASWDHAMIAAAASDPQVGTFVEALDQVPPPVDIRNRFRNLEGTLAKKYSVSGLIAVQAVIELGRERMNQIPGADNE